MKHYFVNSFHYEAQGTSLSQQFDKDNNNA